MVEPIMTVLQPRSDDRDEIGEAFGAIALAAGLAIMETRQSSFRTRRKSDDSPVTEADERAEEIILARLATLLPGVPVIAEESVSRGQTPAIPAAFILVDPLDGTREFLAGYNDFTVNIALVRNGAPVAGAVFAPAMDRLWFSGRDAFCAPAHPGDPMPRREDWLPVRARRAPPRDLVALVSRSHLDDRSLDALSRLPVGERRPMGSSIKFCLIAEGEGDIYPRFGPTMEWDTAAGDAILRAAGGMVLGEDGAPLRYGRAARRFYNDGFIAWGDPAAAAAFEAGGVKL
jgi:3'(2'), 5'-bisphosphate nucleotidase